MSETGVLGQGSPAIPEACLADPTLHASLNVLFIFPFMLPPLPSYKQPNTSLLYHLQSPNHSSLSSKLPLGTLLSLSLSTRFLYL